MIESCVMENAVEFQDEAEILHELKSMEGQVISSIKPRISDDGLSSFYLTLGDGREYFLDSFAMHGMESGIGLSKRGAAETTPTPAEIPLEYLVKMHKGGQRR